MHSLRGYWLNPRSGSSVEKVTSPLENLCGPGKSLRKEPPDAKEFAGLTHSGQARLADAQNANVSIVVFDTGIEK